jgi:hypothetical protein
LLVSVLVLKILLGAGVGAGVPNFNRCWCESGAGVFESTRCWCEPDAGANEKSACTGTLVFGSTDETSIDGFFKV